MSYRKFNSNDILINTMVTYPSVEIYVYNGKMYYNNIPDSLGVRNNPTATDPAPVGSYPRRERNINSGHISLYEQNIDRPYFNTDRIVGETINFTGPEHKNKSYSKRVEEYNDLGYPIDFVEDRSIIYPFITKDGTTMAPKTVSKVDYATGFKYGDVMTAVYPLSASITREFISSTHGARYRGVSSSAEGFKGTYLGIRNRLDHYAYRSRHYKVSSSYGNKLNQTLNFIHIPSIFYGTRIKPGSVSLKFYVTGTLAGELVDTRENGELIQVSASTDGGANKGASNNGKVAGVILYEEGLILLTGSWELSSETIDYGPAEATNARWIYFAAGAGDNIGTFRTDTSDTFKKVSFGINFKGHTETQVISMFTHARSGEANISNNPTYVVKGQDKEAYYTNSIFQQNQNVVMKNIVSSSYHDYNAPYKRQVFISRVGIYDKNKNLLGISTLASPVRKEDKDNYTFKIKLDI